MKNGKAKEHILITATIEKIEGGFYFGFINEEKGCIAQEKTIEDCKKALLRLYWIKKSCEEKIKHDNTHIDASWDKGEEQTCDNCKYRRSIYHPISSLCIGCENYNKWVSLSQHHTTIDNNEANKSELEFKVTDGEDSFCIVGHIKNDHTQIMEKYRVHMEKYLINCERDLTEVKRILWDNYGQIQPVLLDDPHEKVSSMLEKVLTYFIKNQKNNNWIKEQGEY